MTGYEYFKQKRIENGYSVRQFGKAVDITPRMVSYYESGEKPINRIPIYKINVIFYLLGIDIIEFFDCYYPYKEIVDRAVESWKLENPVEYDFQKTKKKIYARLAKIKGRGTIEKSKLDRIYDMYDFFCCECKKNLIGNTLSEEDYKNLVDPIFYQIKLDMSGGLPEKEISRSIMDAFYKSSYKVKDISKICGIASQNLNYYINGKYDYGSLHTDTALKLCYLLKLDFNKLFVSCERNN